MITRKQLEKMLRRERKKFDGNNLALERIQLLKKLLRSYSK